MQEKGEKRELLGEIVASIVSGQLK